MSTRVRLGSAAKKISSCVRPGVLEVRAKALRPVRALIRLDLPTFERPAKAISRPATGGKSPTEAQARENVHCPANSRRPVSISLAEKPLLMGAVFPREATLFFFFLPAEQ